MHRRLRKRKSSNVDLNLAAMLDMAFQLLTFFILTFRPAPIEGELGLHLPPPVPITKNVDQGESTEGGANADVEDVEKLDLMITSDDSGEVSMIKAGMRALVSGRMNKPNIMKLDDQLKKMFDEQVIPLDRVQLAVDERLRYEELMKIIDVCTKQKLKDGKNLQRISFIAVKAPGG